MAESVSDPGVLISSLLETAGRALDKVRIYTDALQMTAYANQPQVFARSLTDYSVVETPPLPDIPPMPTTGELGVDFAATLDTVESFVDGLQNSWLMTYFPAALPSGLDPLLASIIDGVLVDATTQEIMWERAKAQTLRDAARFEDTVVTAWASRGFSMPGGVVNNQIQMKQQDSHFTAADIAAQQAIKALEIQVEAVKFAADVGVKLKLGLLSGISSLVTAYTRLPSAAAEYASAVAEAKRASYAAITEYYRTVLGSAEIKLKVSMANAENDLKYAGIAGSFIGHIISQQVEVGKASVDSYARTAAAAYNGFNAVASVSSTVASSGA